MNITKRCFDIAFSFFLIFLLLMPILIICLGLYVSQGRPVFYSAERMKTPEKSFKLLKFRTMTVSDRDSGVSGANKKNRITSAGRILRKYRLDELPQLWNVLIGDMSFVGPRPPLREYVERCPDIYEAVLRSKPGITGLATLYFHRHEEWILARSYKAADTDANYVRRCIPVKAKIDLIYQNHTSLRFDLLILFLTIKKVFLRGPNGQK